MKPLRIDAPGEELDLVRGQAFSDQFLPGALGGDIDPVHLVVIPADIFPGEIFDIGVLGQVAGVLRDRGVIGAVTGQLQDAGDRQGRQPDRTRGGRVDGGELFPVTVLQHFQERRKMKFEFRVLGQVVGSDRAKFLDFRFSVLFVDPVTGDDREPLVVLFGHGHLLLEGQRHPVDLIKGIGKMGDPQAPGVWRGRAGRGDRIG